MPLLSEWEFMPAAASFGSFTVNRLGEDGGRGWVPSPAISEVYGRHFSDHLSAHVFKFVFQLIPWLPWTPSL
jgi:hypothetical protein